MAVIKRLTCTGCKKTQEVQTLERKPPACPICGEKREYGDRWIVSLILTSPEGKKFRYFKAYSEKKSEAQAHEAEMKQRQTVPQSTHSTSFEALAEGFEEWCNTKVAEGTLGSLSAKSYLSRLRVHLIPYYKGYDANHIDEEAVEKYRLIRLKAGAKPATVNREVGTLKRLLSLAARRKKIDANHLAGMEMLKENNHRERVLTLEEIEQLLVECANISGRCHMATMIALNTGLRHDGVVSLKWSEIVAEGGAIKKKVKGGKIVTIPLNPDLQDALDHWKEGKETDPKGYVLPSPKKEGAHMLVSSNFGFGTACKKSGIGEGFTFHDLRHTFATHFIKLTRDIHLTAKILGHSTTYITERYAHLVDDQAADAMKGFSLKGL